MATMITSTGERLLTLEEYEKLPDNGRPTELVRGRVVEMNPPYVYHGYVCIKVARIIGGFGRSRSTARDGHDLPTR